MPNFNAVILMGHLTAKPELLHAQSGKSWCKFSVAVNEYFSTKDGEPSERVSFIDVACFGRQAEAICRYLDKGDPILVDGRLTQDRWETEDGQKRNKLRVTMRRFEFVGGRPKGSPSPHEDYDESGELAA